MERYFLGNNTAYGFKGFYEDELRRRDPVVLLKGGPGTGKSSILKRVAAEAKRQGYDCELWYCSGDPSSLDGVMIKELNAVVTDATAPHASGAELPAIKDFIVDLASSLSHEKLAPNRDKIEEFFAIKRAAFKRAYRHLRLAKCHMDNVYEIERDGVKEEDIRAYAALFAANLRETCRCVREGGARRRLFARAISPAGENCYFDHLRGKKIYKVSGGSLACALFMAELEALIKGGTSTQNPLEPKITECITAGNIAVTCDAGYLARDVYENINLSVYEDHADIEAAEEELNASQVEIALASEALERAREAHLAAEKYFISAMDFENNDRLYKQIIGILGM